MSNWRVSDEASKWAEEERFLTGKKQEELVDEMVKLWKHQQSINNGVPQNFRTVKHHLLELEKVFVAMNTMNAAEVEIEKEANRVAREELTQIKSDFADLQRKLTATDQTCETLKSELTKIQTEAAAQIETKTNEVEQLTRYNKLLMNSESELQDRIKALEVEIEELKKSKKPSDSE